MVLKRAPLPPPLPILRQTAEAAALTPGARCQVQPGDRRGAVRFVGKVPGLAPGFWVGVQFDEPVGKHDGTVKGVRYFECAANFGGMVRPDKVEQGDFPEIDELADLDDEL